MQAFAAIATARSFRGAATRNGVSASSLSAAMRRLESRLGVRLLNRTTRSVTPTEAGQRLLTQLAPALSDIDRALESLRAGNDTHGTLRLNVPVIVARYVLPALLADFLSEHPNIRLELACEERFVDVFAAGFDAGVRYEEAIERDMIAIPLGPATQRYVAAASPAYLRAHGTPEHPRDLARHRCLVHRFESGSRPAWEFVRDDELVRVRPEGLLASASLDVELAAARAGHGVVYTFEEVLAPALADGTLVGILEPWWQRFTGPRLYYPSRRHMPTPLRAFVDFIKQWPSPPSTPGAWL
ncbi:LysR family transcriptional regulator [Oleiagrimonas sp. C23AA]|uniref:LysR family transcriptional regulator n=1 Tax=Oleiagrimonas sp. C23AA TaxID=2719047 RepID=UPI00197F0DD0|nr:LysR family transcriptional regulator [Oleiagrimonas sp. C23AA]